MPARYSLTVNTPLGAAWLAQEGDAIAGFYFAGQKYEANASSYLNCDNHPSTLLLRARQQLLEYFDGTRQHFDLAMSFDGTAFQMQVWRALLHIPYGQTRTYAQLANQLGLDKGAARAVGAANGQNKLSLLVPCHRVIAAGGGLAGYAGGISRKAWLLKHEGVLLL
jgi:methylated-DNA-[protein]-cysteine S-methyltransferase